MNNIKKRINNIKKNNIIDLVVKPGTTSFSLECMHKGEIQIHRKAAELVEKRKQFCEEMKDKSLEEQKAGVEILLNFYTPSEKMLVETSNDLYIKRALDVMNMGVFQFIHYNNPLRKHLFDMRFHWFLHEMSEWLWLAMLEETFSNDKSVCFGQREKNLKKQVYSKWRNWFSRKRFRKWYDENFSEDKLTPEQIEKLSKNYPDLTEKYYKEDLEEYTRFKCAECKRKCNWREEVAEQIKAGHYIE